MGEPRRLQESINDTFSIGNPARPLQGHISVN